MLRYRQAMLLLLCLVCGWPEIGYALEQLRFDHLAVGDGLSQDVVTAITQDGRGFYWIGTQRGLNRYDGYEFRTFYSNGADPNSLPADWIWALHTDRHGDVWIGADSGGVARYDHQAQSFRRYPFVPAIRAIAEDAEGQLWLATDGDGMVRLDPVSGAQLGFPVGNGRVKAVYVDAAGSVWAGTDGTGLFRLKPDSPGFVRVASIPETERVRNIVGDDESVWIGTYENGLYRVDPQTAGVEHLVAAADRVAGLPSNSYRALLIDTERSLWIGNEAAGLTRFVGGSFATFRHSGGNLRSLASNYVSALYEDHQGWLWVGSHAGISVLNPGASAFVNYNELTSSWISGFAEGEASDVWVATMGGGINRVNLTSGTAEPVRDAMLSDRVSTLLIQQSGTVWAGTRASGLSRYDPAAKQWRSYRHDPADPGSLAFDGVTSLLEDSAGRIWVGTYQGGLNRYEPATDSFTRFRNVPNGASSLCAGRVLSVFEDRSRQLWLGTHGDGICRFDPADGTFISIRHEPDQADGLASNDAWLFAEDPAGNLWIGTSDAGVNVWLSGDRAAGRVSFLKFDASDGLASDVVYGLLVDDDGAVWISGSRGITRVVLDAETATLRNVRRFGEIDGLPGSEFNFAAALRMRTGRLLFGGTSGFVAFDPARIKPDRPISELVLTSFVKLNEEVPITDPAQTVVLEHADRLLALSYSTMNFQARRTSQYAHMLEGFDPDWVEDGSRRHVSYTNLEPGTYTFRARAANADGVAGTAEIALPIRVLPAPWASTGAYLAYTLGGLLLVALGWRSFRIRTAQAVALRKAHEDLLGEVLEREIKERQLVAEQRRAQQYLDIVEVIILALDDEGTISLINQKGARVFGRDESEVVGANFFETMIAPAEVHAVQPLLEDASQYAYREFHVQNRAGEERLIAWHVVRLADGLLLSGTDVTQVRALETELQNAQKLEALGTLARGVAHDFNNILSAILGHAELSQMVLPDDHPAQGYQKRIGASVDRAREIIKGILTFGRVSKGTPRLLDLSSTVVEALQLVFPVLPDKVSLAEQLDGNHTTVLADAAQVIQVILNLCTNAIQSIGDASGSIVVSTQPVDLDAEQSHPLMLAKAGRYVLLSVSDDGPGMDEQVQARAFEPYFTTRPPGEGSGLGLSVVHGIVTELRGAIRVHSAPGRGTRFDVYLPYHEGAVAPIEEPAFAPAPQGAVQATVLLVDDEEDIVKTIAGLLEHTGYEVIRAGSGEEAMAFIARAKIDLMITDQTMRGARGQDVAAMAKAARPDLPVILMSGAVRPETDAIDGFIGKPFTRRQLLAQIDEVLALAAARSLPPNAEGS
ncbi:MAG: two-component regulator propeller domain-containing protein [Pseudomonadota bacterium]